MKPEDLFRSPSLKDRHYVIAATVNRVSDQLWATPVKARISQYRARYGDAFAFAIWYSKEKKHFRYSYVMPFALISRSFGIPISKVRDGGWDASIRRGRFLLDGQGEVDVQRCRGDQPDVLALLQAREESQIRELLARLAGGK